MKYSALWLVGKYLKHTTYSVMSGQGARRKQTLLRRVESGGAGDQHLGIRDAGVVSSTLSLQVEQIPVFFRLHSAEWTRKHQRKRKWSVWERL